MPALPLATVWLSKQSNPLLDRFFYPNFYIVSGFK